MLLLGDRADSAVDSDVWTARRSMCADPYDVLHALTDPGAIAEWAPVSFEVDGLAGGRLQAGGRERVSGSIAGIGTRFEIEVRQADVEGLELVARGPITFEVSYEFRQRDDDLLVEAAVRVRRQRGLAAQILRTAVAALFNGGALGVALHRLDSAVSSPVEGELIAA